MIVLIRCEKPLRLKDLLPLWKRINRSVSPQELAQERLERMLSLAESFRGDVEEAVWDAEESALRELVYIDGGDSLHIQSLVVPAALPARQLPLLTGWTVRECAESPVSDFSPLAMVWLRERRVQQIGGLEGRIERVETEDGLALLQISATEEIPVGRERREHDVEHVDEGMVLLQANVDDSSPEWLSYMMEQLFRSGANDVSFLPMTMKKSRPGVMLQVLCYHSQLDAVKTTVFQETSTFGLRYFPVSCHRLARRFVTVATSWGDVPVKLGYHRGERVQVAPEYAVCARLADAAGVPLKLVYQQAVQLASDRSSAKI
ncbi:nickel insertion protein [Brevibacillus sp. H7]|uniref:nickel insertion protein n=1 Tax=Brevibacillus sp. H7 TaxID=3349138 RepID=UPI0037FB16B0